MPCFLPGVTFLAWALLVQFGLDPGATLVPFCVAEGTSLIAYAIWVRHFLIGDWRP